MVGIRVPFHLSRFFIMVWILGRCLPLPTDNFRILPYRPGGVYGQKRHVEFVAITVIEIIEEFLSKLQVKLVHLHLMRMQAGI